MAENRDNDLLLMLLAIIAVRDDVYEDPYTQELIYSYIQRRGKEVDSELINLLESLTFRRRRPRRRRDSEIEEAAYRLSLSINKISEVLEKNTTAGLEEVNTKINRLEENATVTQDTLHNFIWQNTVGVDPEAVHDIRYLPVRVFLADPIPNDREQQLIVDAIETLASLLGFSKAYELPGESGSWWKRFVLRTKEFFSHRDVQDRLRMAEHALEATILDKPVAEANLAQAQGAAALIEALKGSPHACIQAGTLLLVKATNKDGQNAVVVRTLSKNELKHLEENQSMLRKPDTIIEWLEAAKEND